jgi:hypothetical protein
MMASKIVWIAFCTTLSLGEAIVRGLVFVGSDALGISILLDGLNLNWFVRILFAVFSNQGMSILSSVSGFAPFVMLSGLLLISL